MNPEGRVHLEKEIVRNIDSDNDYRASHGLFVGKADGIKPDSFQ